MPSSYAHFRFGQAAAQLLTGDAAKKVRRFRSMYDVGLHGPDFFFYYNPLFRTKTGALGSRFHQQSGQEFFGRAALMLESSPSEGTEAYLYGVLAHYALDAACHPLIRTTAAETDIGHTELEVEFDRYLLESDGCTAPHLEDVSSHMHLSRGECAAIAEVYPPISAFTVQRSVGIMALVTKALASKNRELLERIFRLGGTTAQQMVMPGSVNTHCSHMDTRLLALYNQALDRYPLLSEQLTARFRENVPLEEAFAVTFG